MQRYDFTKTGGFPFTQDVLKDMQDQYMTMMQQLCGNFGPGPYIISGMVQSSGSISDGWFYYNGDVIQFTGGVIPTPAGGSVVLVQIIYNTGTLTFNDGSNPVVMISPQGALTTGASVTDATHFPLSALQIFGKEANWNLITLSSGASGVVGQLYYKKDYISNSLQIVMSVGAIMSSLGAFYNGVLGVLPSGYWPQKDAYFNAVVYHQPLIYDMNTPQAPIKNIPVHIDTSGNINVYMLGSTSVASYGGQASIIIPLD